MNLEELIPAIEKALKSSEQEDSQALGIQTALESQPEFAKGKTFLNGLDSHAGFDARSVSHLLVKQCRSGFTPRAACEWLERVFGREKTTGYKVETLYGITVLESLEIVPGLRVVPFDRVPESQQKRSLLNPSFAFHELPLHPPSAAIIRQASISPVVFSGSSKDLRNEILGADVVSDVVRLWLAHSGPTVVLPGAVWFEYDDEEIKRAQTSMTSSLATSEFSASYVEPRVLDVAGVPARIQAFYALDADERKRVSTALERLHQSLLRHSPADRAIELSIALETMLIGSRNDRGDNTHKIGLRSSLIISQDEAVRTLTRLMVRAAYDVRSKLMHEGVEADRVKPGGGVPPMAAATVMVDVANRVARVIDTIVQRGGFPDWSKIELSGGSTWEKKK